MLHSELIIILDVCIMNCLSAASLKTCFLSVFFSNDKNLCSKALLSGVKALSKNDLEAEVQRSRHGLHIIEGIQAPVQPHNNPQVLSPVQPHVQPHGREKAGVYAGVLQKGEPGINVLLRQNRKSFAVVNGTYHRRTNHVPPSCFPSLT